MSRQNRWALTLILAVALFVLIRAFGSSSGRGLLVGSSWDTAAVLIGAAVGSLVFAWLLGWVASMLVGELRVLTYKGQPSDESPSQQLVDTDDDMDPRTTKPQTPEKTGAASRSQKPEPTSFDRTPAHEREKPLEDDLFWQVRKLKAMVAVLLAVSLLLVVGVVAGMILEDGTSARFDYFELDPYPMLLRVHRDTGRTEYFDATRAEKGWVEPEAKRRTER